MQHQRPADLCTGPPAAQASRAFTPAQITSAHAAVRAMHRPLATIHHTTKLHTGGQYTHHGCPDQAPSSLQGAGQKAACLAACTHAVHTPVWPSRQLRVGLLPQPWTGTPLQQPLRLRSAGQGARRQHIWVSVDLSELELLLPLMRQRALRQVNFAMLKAHPQTDRCQYLCKPSGEWHASGNKAGTAKSASYRHPALM